jgi:competence ComEA-like helix-hairpin-helix protein
MYGLPDSVFQKIRPMLVLSTPDIRKTNLNTASVEDLDKHPYITGKQAKLIVAYREQHGVFVSVDDLAKIAAFTDKKWLEKVGPYLDTR